MRDYSEFLTDREIFVLQNHPAMSYEAIGKILGVTRERVRQLKAHAERRIREERKRDEEHARAHEPVLLSIQRKDIHLILWALMELRSPVLTYRADQRRKRVNGPDPDLTALDDLIVGLWSVLKST